MSMTSLSTGIAGVLLLLTGCSTQSDTPQYYTIALPSSHSQPMAQANALPVVQVADVRLADYLDTMGIVYQTNDVEVITANQHRWAEPLGKQLTTSLLQTLQQQLPNYQWNNNQQGTVQQHDIPQLQIRVTGFHGTADGHAIIQGDWALWRHQQQYSGHFQHTYPLAQSGYDTLVRQLRTGWAETISAVVTQIQPLLTATE
jgi:uncharacterized lipoprotein YmbA